MNILFITQSVVNPLSGGVQRVTYTLGNQFECDGHRVFFLSVNRPKGELGLDPRQVVLPNSNKLMDSANIEYFSRFIAVNGVEFIINQVGIFPEINRFLEQIDRKGVKLINVHHNCVACLNARYREIVLGNTRNSSLWKWIDHPILWSVLKALNRRKYGAYFRKSIVKADQLVLLSPKYIPELACYGIKFDSKDIRAIGNPLSFFPEAISHEKEKRVLFIGRLGVTQKRIDKLLQIWKVLHNEFTDWQFDVVGDGNERQGMQAFVKSNSLHRIHIHGKTDPRPYLERAKFLTLTSDFEGYPMVIVEAQAYGVIPVSYSSFSAVTDLIEDGKSGFIVSDLSVSAYIDRMRNVMKVTDKEHVAMMVAMREKVSHSCPKIVVQQWVKLFADVNGAHQ
jgi:glycosyltransferase involved in cell wall biosynthesis